MTEKNVNQRFLLIGAVLVIGIVLLYPPSQKLRPGLDIAGGTSLIFELDSSDAESDAGLAERVKSQLQKRVDPSGIYNLTWRVQGRNRIEVQMPLPPKEAAARRQAYADALDTLFKQELHRGEIEEAIRRPPVERETALRKLARGNADAALAAVKAGENAAAERAAIEEAVKNRETLLLDAAAQYDAMLATQAALASVSATSAPAAETTSAPTSAPADRTQLEEAARDATENFENSIETLLGKNLNRRRFQEVLELDERSPVRKNSLDDILKSHPDLGDKVEAVLTAYKTFRSGRQFLDGPADLKRLLHGAGKLEFRILAQPSTENVTKYDRYRKQLKDGRRIMPGEPEGWFRVDNPMQFFDLETPAQLQKFDYRNYSRSVVEKLGDDFYVLAKLSPTDGLLQNEKSQQRWRLTRARPNRDEHGRPSVNFTLDPVGGMYFETLTRNNINKPLCILVDDVAYSAPNIQSAIRTDGQITGEFSQEKVSYLVQTMEGGTLAARLKDTPLSERTIGSSLGELNRDYALRAGWIGLIAVVVIMLGYYFFCGAIANIAMLFNVMLTLAVLAMLGARITLDGIAGLILSVGMAVDANVLIYERMREEKERGASLRMIIRNGYDRAFSTIFDSNMTTILTCIIIYYVGSEEVKGFGLTLGWGIALNLFTAVFVTRAMFDFLLKHKIIKDIRTLKLIGVPNIDWYHLAKYLVPVTVAVTLIGVALLFARGKDQIFDIEFLGGVAAEFELKKEGLNDVTIGQRLVKETNELKEDAKRLSGAQVVAAPGLNNVYDVTVPGLDDTERLAAFVTEPLEGANLLARSGVLVQRGQPLRLTVNGDVTADKLAQTIRGLAEPTERTCESLARSNINAVLEVAGVKQHGLVWNVTTTATNMRTFQYALVAAIGKEMNIQPRINYVFRGEGDRPFPVRDRLLRGVIKDVPPDVSADLTDYLGGAAIYLDQLDPPQSVEDVKERLDNMHFQPDFQNQPRRDSTVIGLNPVPGTVDDKGRPVYRALVVAVVDPDIKYADNPETWYTGFAQSEMQLVKGALSTEQTLRKVMQFKPQIAARATQQASMALVLSWAMIVAYIWIRFGRAMYGVGGVIALIHDVLLALAFVGFSGWIASTKIGQGLLVEDFRINMPIIAALLTIVGYSVNDTIVVFDRIRETRGRLGIVTPEIINAAINQTLSRTLMTVFTVFVVIVIAYIFGGSSIRGFNYCMLIGVLTGCYSSIAIASPLLLLRFTHRGIHTSAGE